MEEIRNVDWCKERKSIKKEAVKVKENNLCATLILQKPVTDVENKLIDMGDVGNTLEHLYWQSVTWGSRDSFSVSVSPHHTPAPRAGTPARTEKGHGQPHDEAGCGTNMWQRHTHVWYWEWLTDGEAGAASYRSSGENSCHGGLLGDVMLLPSPGDRNVPPDCYTGEQKWKQAASPFWLLKSR